MLIFSQVFAEVSKNNNFSLSANSFPSLYWTSLGKSILFPHKTKIALSVLTCLIKLIQVFKFKNVDFFDISYTINTTDDPLTYDGINALYLSWPAESQNWSFIEFSLYSIVFVAKSTPIVGYFLF